MLEFDAIPVHFYLECPIPKTKPWEYEIQSDKPHANVCVFAMYLPGVDGRVIKHVGLHVRGPWVRLKNNFRKLKNIFENFKSRIRKTKVFCKTRGLSQKTPLFTAKSTFRHTL